jgi:hypothetical protein
MISRVDLITTPEADLPGLKTRPPPEDAAST